MSSQILIEDVSLKFRIYNNPIPSLKESIIDLILHNRGRHQSTEFYALQNISLSINGGDRLGIIGLNGAGKSTLLKTIAGIYTPQHGKITINGRVTPMIELGAGFDPEQTGRDNIFLNGALLGHSPKEMSRIEKEIIEFSELGDFINLPVKYYSSGMYSRLAFSIATITDSEILLIDEILAAGDAHFVTKAHNRLSHLIENSQIVVMVSHSLDQVARICNKVIVLNKGQIINTGTPQEMIDFYMKEIIK